MPASEKEWGKKRSARGNGPTKTCLGRFICFRPPVSFVTRHPSPASSLSQRSASFSNSPLCVCVLGWVGVGVLNVVDLKSFLPLKHLNKLWVGQPSLGALGSWGGGRRHLEGFVDADLFRSELPQRTLELHLCSKLSSW